MNLNIKQEEELRRLWACALSRKSNDLFLSGSGYTLDESMSESRYELLLLYPSLYAIIYPEQEKQDESITKDDNPSNIRERILG